MKTPTCVSPSRDKRHQKKLSPSSPKDAREAAKAAGEPRTRAGGRSLGRLCLAERVIPPIYRVTPLFHQLRVFGLQLFDLGFQSLDVGALEPSAVISTD
jgi:hypothetical protein